MLPIIRAARPDDAAVIAEIHVRSWQVAYRGLMASEFLDALSVESRRDWWTRRLSLLDPGHAVLVLEDLSGVAGFSYLGPSHDGDGEVYAIYLHPVQWGRGHGRRLLTSAEATLAGAGHERGVLWVLEGNDRARRFYEACGWSADGALKLEEIGHVQVTEMRYRKDLDDRSLIR